MLLARSSIVSGLGFIVLLFIYCGFNQSCETFREAAWRPYLFIYLSIYLFIYLFIYLIIYLFNYLVIYLFICLSIYWFNDLFNIYLFIYSIFIYLTFIYLSI